MGTCYSHLSPDERIRIERLYCEQGLSVRETAGLIGRDKATVSRELKRVFSQVGVSVSGW